MNVEMHEITDLDSFKKMESEIDTLVNDCTGKLLYVTFDYLISWLTSIGAGRQFRILVMYKEKNLIAMCPLIDNTFIGAGLWGMIDVPCREENKREVLPLLINYLLAKKSYNHLEFGPLVSDSTTVAISENYLLSKNVRFTKIQVDGNPYINTTVGLETYKQTLTKKCITQDIERCQRRLSEKGQLSLHCLNNKEEITFHLTNYFEIYLKQWPVNRFKKNSGFKNLYIDFAYRALSKGFLAFTVLLLDDKPLAYHYGFLHKKSLYWFTPTYDIDWKKFSPGKILMWKIIEDCFNKKNEFDFQNGMESYKMQWTKTYRNRIILKF
jgi:hypothetical protein